MITGRGPGAPSVTPNSVLTLRQSAPDRAADLVAIRQTDALIDLLGSRRLRRPHTSGDPALILLSSLAADVDSPAPVSGTGAAGAMARPEEATAAPAQAAPPAAGESREWALRRPGAIGALPAAGRGAAGEWAHTTAAAAVIATAVAVLAVAGLLVAGMLVRLTGMPARLWLRRPGGPGRIN
ncbi:MAG TPA: hypothetical protein VIV12_24465 [Streptosporangiaceae bacterium]